MTLDSLSTARSGGLSKDRHPVAAALAEIADLTVHASELAPILEKLLDDLIDECACAFAVVFLVDEERCVIEAVQARNVPREWTSTAVYGLDSDEIHACLVRLPAVQLVGASNPKLDKMLLKGLHREAVIRLLVPLFADEKVIGMIDCGFELAEEGRFSDDSRIKDVEVLAGTYAPLIAPLRPFVLLRTIVRNAIQLIGAGSASLHLYVGNKLLLRAGAGRATADFLDRFPARPDGIGRRASAGQTPIVLDDPEVLRIENPRLFAEGVRGMAALPLRLGNPICGVLYVHFWHDHRFTSSELDLELIFASQMELAIHSLVLLRKLNVAAQRAWSVADLQTAVQSVLSGSLDQVLRKIARYAIHLSGADCVTLYEYLPAQSRFEERPVAAGEFFEGKAIRDVIDRQHIAWRLLTGNRSRFLSDVQNEFHSDADMTKRSGGFAQREKIISCAALLLRCRPTDETVGVMFVNFRSEQTFDEDDKKLLKALGSFAATAISIARQYEQLSGEVSRKRGELEALRAIDRAIVQNAVGSDLRPVYDLIVRKALEITGAPAGAILLHQEWNGTLMVVAQQGFPEATMDSIYHFGDGIIGLAAEWKKSIVVDNVEDERWRRQYRQVRPSTQSELALPLIENGRLIGVLNIEDDESHAFTEDHRNLLENLAVQAVVAARSVGLSEQLQMQIRPLRVLNMIVARVHAVANDLDAVLRAFLTGLTAAEGLSFSRAVVLLADDDCTVLRGRVAVGPLSRAEAESTWQYVDRMGNELRRLNGDVLSWLLERSLSFSTNVRSGRDRDTRLSLAVQRIEIPLTNDVGAPGRALLKGRSISLSNGADDVAREWLNSLADEDERDRALLCVPLCRDEVRVGVLIVDHAYLPGRTQIDESIVNGVEAFASAMATAIEFDRLKRRLLHEQRMKDWRSFVRKIGHTVGTHINIFRKSVDDLEELTIPGQGGAGLVDIHHSLKDRLWRIQQVLNDFRRFGEPSALRLDCLDIRTVLALAVRDGQLLGDTSIEWAPPDGPVFVNGDEHQLAYAFTQLIENSQQAMTGQTSPTPVITINMTVEVAEHSSVCVQVCDTGPGVATSLEGRIFEPGFTTKTSGTGLGLTIVQDIITQHRGDIRIENVGSPGAHFVVRLPFVSR